ncbi:hypothetical protein OUZ56_006259 [Daphnia magna]|uniref:Uncharacterized protein n=1 Tax=Daphnia magna TaxID=35525 RepID=A0ABQ9YWG6_9CRUS|nr:hypothetical protein OUZ56_006259 [Daphnia magna]
MTLVFTPLLEFACYHCLRPSQDKITSQVKSDCDVMKLVLNVDEDLEKSPYLMSANNVNDSVNYESASVLHRSGPTPTLEEIDTRDSNNVWELLASATRGMSNVSSLLDHLH